MLGVAKTLLSGSATSSESLSQETSSGTQVDVIRTTTSSESTTVADVLLPTTTNNNNSSSNNSNLLPANSDNKLSMKRESFDWIPIVAVVVGVCCLLTVVFVIGLYRLRKQKHNDDDLQHQVMHFFVLRNS